jgi:hypothetical protein
MQKRWIAVGLVVAIIIMVFLLVYYTGFSNFQFPSSYTKVSVPLEGNANYESYGIDSKIIYTFGWRSSTQLDPRAHDTNYFSVFPMYCSYDKSTGLSMPDKWGPESYFAVTVGSSYQMGSASSYYGGIEIKVSEIHGDYIVLLVKPL